MMQTLTVRELIASLQHMPDDAPVLVWLPGSQLELSRPFQCRGAVMIEGNVEPGSAIKRLVTVEAGGEECGR